MPKSFSVEPLSEGTSVKVTSKKTIHIAVINDVHVPFHDEQAVNLAFQVIDAATPELIIINGDFIDFFAISRFDKNPRRKLMLGEEIKEARKLLNRMVSRFDPEAWVFVMGNHEDRLKSYLWHRAPELFGLDELSVEHLLGLRERENFIVLNYKDTPMPVGYDVAPTVHFQEFFVSHGDKIRLSGNTVNLARSVFLRILRNAVLGHWHRGDVYIQMDYLGKAKGCWIVPCLSYQRPHWDSGRIWSQGLCIIEMNARGFFKVDIINFIRENGYLLSFWNGKEFRVKGKG